MHVGNVCPSKMLLNGGIESVAESLGFLEYFVREYGFTLQFTHNVV